MWQYLVLFEVVDYETTKTVDYWNTYTACVRMKDIFSPQFNVWKKNEDIKPAINSIVIL